MAENIRTPQQQRSIDKKNRIIEAGYSLFAEKGFFNTNTAEIAKYAGVSTGIVYGYFHDKRDILLEALDVYITKVFMPVIDILDGITSPDLCRIVPKITDCVVDAHRTNASMHNTLHSLAATDEAISNKFGALEAEMTKRIAAKLEKLGFSKGNLYEKVHTAIMLVQSFAHEAVFDNHCYINYTEMRQIVINMVISIFDK